LKVQGSGFRVEGRSDLEGDKAEAAGPARVLVRHHLHLLPESFQCQRGCYDRASRSNYLIDRFLKPGGGLKCSASRTVGREARIISDGLWLVGGAWTQCVMAPVSGRGFSLYICDALRWAQRTAGMATDRASRRTGEGANLALAVAPEHLLQLRIIHIPAQAADVQLDRVDRALGRSTAPPPEPAAAPPTVPATVPTISTAATPVAAAATPVAAAAAAPVAATVPTIAATATAAAIGQKVIVASRVGTTAPAGSAGTGAAGKGRICSVASPHLCGQPQTRDSGGFTREKMHGHDWNQGFWRSSRGRGGGQGAFVPA
jgi:hypothetical protein